ncbi:6-bladed beta-propeller [Rhodothermus marinus]|jgi:hypothetical protein|uniref:6-bladed beta-propeller n=1 Tax=Rhodothermus marinus TaxID=29549 RepID=UPI000223DD5B|nr:6-bladed beta-propeller [Rhodothermus marinus]AEN73748.1 NHL repeat containing protein [Rhodothermus marinus SG0.5JP17-172]MBO2491537.1 6-bladed beta-propeller [Rhodothermus marinus]
MYRVGLLTGWLQVLLLTSAVAQPVLTPQRLLENERVGAILGLALDHDGRLYVADPVNRCVHVFSETGTYLRQIGQPGMGPGEFQALAAMVIRHNQLYTLDVETRRLTRFSLDGTLLGTLSIQAQEEEPTVSADLLLGARGLWVAADSQVFILTTRPFADPTQAARPIVTVRPLNPDGTLGAPVLELPDTPRHVEYMEGGVRVDLVPLGPRPVIALTPDDQFVYGYTERLEVYRKPRNGPPQLLIRQDIPRVPISDAMLEAYLQEIGVTNPEAIARNRRIAPKHLSAFQDLIVDDQGQIWVAVNTPESVESGQTEYWVFGPDGQLRRKLRLDRVAYFYLIRQGTGYALTATDEGVQQIAVYAVK